MQSGAGCRHAICDDFRHACNFRNFCQYLRQHFGASSTNRRFVSPYGVLMRAATDIDDLQRGIQLAFAVPETHVASAIGYLLAENEDRGNTDEMAAMFDSLATPEGWALCADLLKVRLQLRAGKLRQTRDVD